MRHRNSLAAVVLAAGLGAGIAAAQAFDKARYPDLKGQWVRGYPGLSRFDPAKPAARSRSVRRRPYRLGSTRARPASEERKARVLLRRALHTPPRRTIAGCAWARLRVRRHRRRARTSQAESPQRRARKARLPRRSSRASQESCAFPAPPSELHRQIEIFASLRERVRQNVILIARLVRRQRKKARRMR